MVERDMKAVVLAAGEGQRLRPLTLTRPKHMIPVGGKPILEHLLSALKIPSIEEVLIVVNYKAEIIKAYFGDGSKYGVKIRYVVQEKVAGTADAVHTVEEYVGDEDFLTVNGDLLVSDDVIKSVINIHRRDFPIATLAAVRVERPKDYGVLKVDSGKLVDIIEKPSEKGIGNLVNAGIYVFSAEIFDFIKRTEPSPRGEIEITDSIRSAIIKGEKVSVVEIPSDKWLDIGRPWDLFDANMRVLKNIKPDILGRVEEGVHIKGPVFIGNDALIRSGSYIEGPVFIGDGCDIGPNCYIRPYTSIGRNVRVGNACEVKNSILMDNVHVGHLSYIGDSIIGENCNLGAGFISANLRFDKKTVCMNVR
ncbi:MAG: sugar phosphate nucleotidyltransferase, partial [Candidatus Bathyarchaeia archaeon]